MWYFIFVAVLFIVMFELYKHRAAVKAEAQKIEAKAIAKEVALKIEADAEAEKITAQFMAQASKVRTEIKAKL